MKKGKDSTELQWKVRTGRYGKEDPGKTVKRHGGHPLCTYDVRSVPQVLLGVPRMSPRRSFCKRKHPPGSRGGTGVKKKGLDGVGGESSD